MMRFILDFLMMFFFVSLSIAVVLALTFALGLFYEHLFGWNAGISVALTIALFLIGGISFSYAKEMSGK